MQAQVHFTFSDEAEFIAFTKRFALDVAPVAEKKTAKHETAKVAEEALAKEAESKPAKVVKTAEKESVPPEPTEEGDAEIAFVDVKDAILNVSRTKGRDKALEILAKFGVTKVGPDLKITDYVNVVKLCAEALAE